MKLQQAYKPQTLHQGLFSVADDYIADVQISRFDRRNTRTQIVVFDVPTVLYDWCSARDVRFAVNGGFTVFHRGEGPTKLLGSHRAGGAFLPSVPYHLPHSAVLVSPDGRLDLIQADEPIPEEGDYFEAGPMLVKNGRSLVGNSYDFEGIRISPLQMDDDWTFGRFPRSAIGVTEDEILVFTCDGYLPPDHDQRQGLTLEELAQIAIDYGVRDLINLDGGSKATHIFEGELLNTPRGGTADNYSVFKNGRPLMSAIIFEPF